MIPQIPLEQIEKEILEGNWQTRFTWKMCLKMVDAITEATSTISVQTVLKSYVF